MLGTNHGLDFLLNGESPGRGAAWRELRVDGLQFPDLLRKLRNDGERVAHNEQVGELADRDAAVFVDGDDGFRSPHADFVLNRTRDADREVKLRADGFPGLPDLV